MSMGRLKELRKYVDNELNQMEYVDVIHHTMNDSSKAVKGEGVPVALLFEPTGAKRRQGAGEV